MHPPLMIVGGGIGGMSAALALHRAGRDFRLFEQAPQFTEIGAGLSLWPNATRVLQSLGVLERVLQLGEPVTQFNLQRPDGRPIASIPMGGYATPALCIHRADLHQALREHLPVESLEPNQRLQSFNQEPDGVSVRFESGLEVGAPGLIGADGIKSRVRAQLHGKVEPAYRGYCIWRGLAPAIGGIERGHIGETWGHGQRFGILPLGQGRICWYATQNGPPARPDAPEGRKSELLNLFKNWHAPVTALIEATAPGDIMKNDARDRSALPQWGRGRVTLLGDAAHPITPNVGQGACMAIEDAACLTRHVCATSNLTAAFRAYEKARRPRTSKIARQARWIGMIGQWENPWLGQARNLITRLVLSRPPDRQLNAVYAYEA